MNLHAVASSVIQVVNPMIDVTIKVSTGYVTLDDGSRENTYDVLTGIRAQVQAMTYGDLRLTDNLVLQGERRKFYLFGRYDSASRERQTGGDIMVFPDGEVWPYGTSWFLNMVIEQWPDWCSVIGTQQMPEP